MTIDINELREAIQTFGSQAINEGDLNELLERLEVAESVLKGFGTTAQEVECWLERYRCLEREAEALRAKVDAMEKQEQQEPFDADSDVFRSAFEAALKAGNWPATRQGDGYRSPSTQIAWRIAFSTVNRLKLYLDPGAKGEEK